MSVLPSVECECNMKSPDPSYTPFITHGLVALASDHKDQRPVTILRDTGAAQSFILAGVLPLSDRSSCDSSVLVQGIEMGFVPVPLHHVYVKCDLVCGVFKVGVRPTLPIEGVSFILGNDIAGGKVLPVLEVLDSISPQTQQDDLAKEFPNVFPACVVTRAQAKKFIGESSLFWSELAKVLASDEFVCSDPVTVTTDCIPNDTENLKLPVTREELMENQKVDPSLEKCFVSIVDQEAVKAVNVAYFIEDGLLMRKWLPHAQLDNEWRAVYPIVVPTAYRGQVLSVAHEHPWAGHVGVTKTYDRVLRHFFWPGLKRDVAKFCRTCHICQVVGKPNQVIAPAPLRPIPAMGEPFEHVLVDCVGPLPKTRSGNQFLLTIMCIATRYPEAIPLRKITAQSVVKALIKFFSTFGLPKTLQSDQGTNFTSNIFNQVLKTL